MQVELKCLGCPDILVLRGEMVEMFIGSTYVCPECQEYGRQLLKQLEEGLCSQRM